MNFKAKRPIPAISAVEEHCDQRRAEALDKALEEAFPAGDPPPIRAAEGVLSASSFNRPVQRMRTG